MSETNGSVNARPELPRLSTGNAELDEILGGGFPANSINILMGEPGSGKTILAKRLMFANANDDGRPILFLATLSEPLDKVVRYLQQFSFFDETKLTGSIIYESMGEELAEKGVSMLMPRLKEAIKTHRPKIIVIDSFKAVHDLSTSVPEMRRMLFEVAGLSTRSSVAACFAAGPPSCWGPPSRARPRLRCSSYWRGSVAANSRCTSRSKRIRRGGDIRRMAIDLAAASDTHRLHGYLYALPQHFAVSGVTTFFSYETANDGAHKSRLSALSDNIFLLGVEVEHGQGRRTMRVVKARGIEHDLDMKPFRITGRGVEVS